jgi:hypothetical protein
MADVETENTYACLDVKRLSDVDLDVLHELVEHSFAAKSESSTW